MGNDDASSQSKPALVGIDPESQRLGSDERNQIALPLPGRGLAQGCDQFIVSLRPGQRAVTILHRTGDEDNGITRDRKLTPAALAPQFERRFAVVADLQRRT